MATTKKQVITIETRQRTVIRPDSPQIGLVWCELCAAEVEAITPKSAAYFLNVSVREVFRRIERGDLHFFELNNSEVFICKGSLIGETKLIEE